MSENNKKKILYVITKAEPFGGAQRYVLNLATKMKDTFEVSVAFGGGGVLERKLKSENIKTISLRNSQRNINLFKDFFLFLELLKMYKKEKPEIIHLNSSKIGFLGALAARIFYTLHPIPYTLVFTAHGWAFNDSKFFLSKIIFKFLQWLTIILSDKTIAVSKKTKKDADSLPFTSSKIEIVHNGIEPINFLTREESREKIYNEKKDALWIGTISELNKNKGIDILIEASKPIIQKNPNVLFVVLGEGEERKKLEKKIISAGISKNFLIKGFLENAQSYLKAFDIFVLPSRTEGLPYVLLEAGTAELAVIASNAGGVSEIIENEKTGILTEKENIKSLSENLTSLINNSEKGKKLGENLRAKIENDFNLKRFTENTLKVYNK